LYGTSLFLHAMKMSSSSSPKRTTSQIILIVLALFLFYISLTALKKYTREGDLKNILDGTHHFLSNNKEEKKEDLVEHIYHLALYKNAKVRWPLCLILALSVTIIILALTNSISATNLFILFPFIFAGYYIPMIWESTHINASLSTEATWYYQKYLLLRSFNKKKKEEIQ
jgi:hypothetical protein